MPSRRTPAGELFCLALLFAFLLWVPLPFGSTPDEFQLPLVGGALAVCAITAATIARSKGRLALSRAHRVWSGGAVIFMLLVALQLVEMPDSLLRAISPESARIWLSAGHLTSSVLGARPPSMHSITVDPPATTLHFFRLLAYFATFTAASLLVRRAGHRVAFAVVLSIGALFQGGYGLNESALHRFSIWGWKNTLMYDRVTGTFVNPNHFADYAAIVAPLGFFILAYAWHDASPSTARLRYRLMRMMERRFIPGAFGALVVGSCLVSILLSKSRGALLALLAGAAVGFAATTGRRPLRLVFFAAAALAAVVTISLYLGRERTSMSRLVPTGQDVVALGGRRTGLETALTIWRRYPFLGSGLGTFERLAPSAQPGAVEQVYNHAHDDYAEIAATTGAVGLIAFLTPVIAGIVLFARSSFLVHGTWRRRGFHAAALASIVAGLVHALVDFPFFIPANAATLAAIAGVAVATKSEPSALRGSALEDSQS